MGCFELISNGRATLNGLRNLANVRGMVALRADGTEKVKAGNHDVGRGVSSDSVNVHC